jgi:hypothetical protein
MGYAVLTVPSSELEPGKPVILTVIGENAESRAWYMTFKSPVLETAECTPLPALIWEGNRLVQKAVLSVSHIGGPLPVTVYAQGMRKIKGMLRPGYNRFTLTFPEVRRERKIAVSIQSERKLLHGMNLVLKPVKKWFIYLVQHTHTDIGYTRPQSTILPEHLRFIDYALDYCDQTDDYPDDAKFRWTCETSWAVSEYIGVRPSSQIERLKKRIEQGRIEVAGLFLNMSEAMDEATCVASLAPLARFRDNGIKVKAAMQNDINGIAWCMADYLSDVGIQYLIMGEHGHRALIPFDIPTAFWWESPAGKRILAWRPDHYHTGNSWQIEKGDINKFGRGLFGYLSDLEGKQYPHDRIAVQYGGYITDNAPPSTVASDMIREWNEKYVWPRLRNAVISEFPEYIESSAGEKLDVHRLAWPDWWSDGFGSAARETAAARRMQVHMLALQTSLAMMPMMGLTIPVDFIEKVDDIYTALLFYDEHTFGAAESVSDPYSENSMVQWGEKSAYVWEAMKKGMLLEEAILGRIQPLFTKTSKPSIVVLNTLNWERSAYQEIYIDHQIMTPWEGNRGRIVDGSGRVMAAHPLASRSDGTTWGVYFEDIPPMGYKTFYIEGDEGFIETTSTYDGLVLENRYYRIEIDSTTGTISRLYDKALKLELLDVDAEWKLGQIVHETLGNRHQLEQFTLEDYSRNTLFGVKTDRSSSGPVWDSIIIHGKLEGCEEKNGVRLEIKLFKREKRIELDYTIRKQRCTAPEGLYVAFPFKLEQGQLSYEAQGSEVRPGIDQLPRTSSDWHAVQNYTRVKGPSGQILLTTDEILLAQFGAINTGKFQPVAKVEKPHVFSWVMNNYWVTNFKASQEGEFHWSYALTSSSDRSSQKAVRFGWGARIPFLTRVLPAGDGKGAIAAQSFFHIDAPNVLMVNAKPSRDGLGIVIHLRELEGERTQLSIPHTFKKGGSATFTRVNAVGKRIGKKRSRLVLEPYESVFLRIDLYSPR